MLLFEILWTSDAVICLAILYFFLMGLGTGSIAQKYMFGWPAAAVTMGSILASIYWLQFNENQTTAFILLSGFSLCLLFTVWKMLIATSTSRRLN